MISFLLLINTFLEMYLINQRWTMNKDKNKKQVGSMDYRKS